MEKLVAKKVNFIYHSKGKEDDVQALQDINLEIEDKSFVVAIGASGCGKTTLLNLFAGFLHPTTGKIFYSSSKKNKKPEKPITGPGSDRGVVFQRPMSSSGSQQITGPGSDRGVVFQRHALLPWLNVIDNVSFGLKLQNVPLKEREEVSMDNLKLVGLEDFVKSKIYQLSGGMQQRVGIARALTSNPSTLLMDEPLGALDALTRENTQELILDIWQKTSKKVFFITHSVEEAIFMATDLIVMSPRPGRITHRFKLGFCSKYLKIRDARKIKSLPEFIKIREQILEIIYADEKNN
ncbi:MAG: ATP-binding cassette domain-containing protein [Candidatus Portiera sp.]|nr:ATP-binding cassette domain-containing protein [Portiera sp.]